MKIEYTTETGKPGELNTSDTNPVAVLIRATEIVKDLQKKGYQPESIKYIADALKLIADGLNQCTVAHPWIVKP